MNSRIRAGLISLTVTVLSACATTGAGQGSGAADNPAAMHTTPMVGRQQAALLSYRVHDWSAADDSNLVVESVDGTRYQAQFFGLCSGLRLAKTIAFITRGSARLDHFAGIVLPDGTACAFRSFAPQRAGRAALRQRRRPVPLN